ncbi:LysM peptidoglycan-binding domain-containing protein [Pseudomonas mediterranea]|uniref:LysM peptidoglycan-binding domain-containing protein n=1 Tax=Pseudomonas mediterranea TaxID=183795 RepID=UPI0006D8AAE4|nr:LysM peptidoglycan-binding domain-containing protein [Pseudomonas mediterranea]MDU9030471.1 LysM peptidoglycan-binding domain-containing protein [Pseudomonas mediterranea]
MVAIVAGNGLGLFNASLNSLGGGGVGGQGNLGQAGGQALVNVSNGNLVLRFTDEQLSGLGQDLLQTRTYNTQGGLSDGDADGWRWDGERSLVLTGTVNTVGSQVTRTTGDGHQTVYQWNGSQYQSTEGDGAHDMVVWDAGAAQMVWTDGSRRVVERYDGNGRLLSTTDAHGTQISYGYDANGRLSSVEDSSGQALVLNYNAAGKLERVDTRSAVGSALTQQVYYGYDAQGRLISVSTDLSPEDNSIADGNVYRTDYSYDGASFRIASVVQSDGTSASFTYQLLDGEYRVKTVIDGSGTTTFSYDLTNNRTDVLNGLGQQWSYFYDADDRLIEVQTPAVNGQRLSTRYAYDLDGNVTSITDGRGNTITYQYDANGNVVLERDATGATVARTYSAANQLLNEIRYSAAAVFNSATGLWTEPPASTAQVTRLAYDSDNRVRFMVDGRGQVTEYRYNAQGLKIQEISYGDALFALSGLAPETELTEAQLVTWADARDKTRSILTELSYDYRGNLSRKVTYGVVNAVGAGSLESSTSVTEYVYSQYGQLLQTLVARGADRSQKTTLSSVVYDGLGRVISQTDSAGTRTTAYNGTNRTVAVTSSSGMTLTQTYNGQGQLIGLTQTAAGQTPRATSYVYDVAGRQVMVQDATGARSYTFYDEAGRVSAQVDGVGAVTEYSYNAAGQRVQEKRYATLVDTSTWSNGTAVVGDLNPVTNSADRLTTLSYDNAGRLSTRTDAIGTLTAFTYDGQGRLIQQQTGDRTTRFFYDASGHQSGQLDTEGYLRENRYDATGRLIQSIRYATQTLAANRASGTLDQLRQSSANDLSSWYFYDTAGRQIGSVDEKQFVTETVYDEAGNTQKTIRYATAYTAAISDTTAFATVKNTVATGTAQTTTTVFDEQGRVAQRVATDGTITAYEYDSAGRLVRETQAQGTTEERSTLTRYDAFGQTIGKLLGEASARITTGMSDTEVAAIYAQYGLTYQYDAIGRVASASDALGNRTLSYYDAAGRLTHVVNALGEVSETVYSAFGDVRERTAFTGRLAESDTATLSGGVLNAQLNTLVQAIRNANSDNRRTYDYDTRGLLTSTTDALGYVTRYGYNAFGNQTSVTRTVSAGNTITSSTTYNSRGEQIGRVDDVGGLARSTAISYDAFGRVLTTTDGRGLVSSTSYDQSGRIITTTNALGQRRSSEYDAFGRVFKQTDALGNITTYRYNDSDRSLIVTTPDGVSVTTVNTRHGQTLTFTDGSGNTTRYAYDKNGQVISVLDALGRETSNAYDEAGNLLGVTDALGRMTRYGYDAAYRMVTRTDAAGTITRYTFDGQGRRIQVVEAEGSATPKVTTYAYDSNGQTLVVTQDPAGLQLTTTYSYDGLGNQVQVALGTVANPNQQNTLYEFDNLGRRISERQDPTGLNLTTQYRYNSNDQVTRKIDPAGNSTWYVYDNAGHLSETVNALGGVTRNRYDAAGNLLSTTRYATALDSNTLATFGDAVLSVAVTLDAARDQTTTYVYDDVGRVRYSINALNQISEMIYDANGRVSETRQYDKAIAANTPATLADIATALVTSGAQARSTRSVYDAAGQLLSITDAAGKVESYTYDAVGNRLTLTNKNGSVWNYRYDTLNRLVLEIAPAISVASMDANGAVTTKTALPITVITYDALGNISTRTVGRLRSSLDAAASTDDLSQARTTRYAYDAVGHQVLITSPGWYNKTTGAFQQASDGTANTFQITTEVTYDALGNAVRNRVRVNNTGVAATDFVDSYKVYDSLGRLRHDIDALNGVTGYTYDAQGNRLTTRRYANALNLAVPAKGYYTLADQTATSLLPDATQDRTLTTRYDALGRKISVQQDQVSLYSFTGVVSTSTLITAAPTTLYSYDAFGQLVRETQVARNASGATVMTGASSVHYYDQVGNRIGSVDALGNYTRMEYDAQGKLSRQVEYANALTAWNENSVPSAPVASANDRSTRYDYDAMGRLSQVTQEGVRYWQQTINATNGVVSATAVVGNLVVSRLTYDGVGNTRTVTDAAGNVTTTDYNALGQVSKVTEPARVTAKSGAVDPFASAVVLASPVTTYAVNAFGQVLSETRTAGSTGDAVQAGLTQTTRTRYDAAGYEIQEIDAAGSAQNYKIDVAGRRLEESRQVSATLSAWTSGGTAVSYNQTLKRTFEYDALGQQAATVDWYTDADGTAQSTRSSVLYNRFGEVTQKLLNGNPLSSYVYDQAGLVIQQQDAQGISQLAYDLSGKASRSIQLGDTATGADDRISYVRNDLLGRALELHLPAFEANLNADTLNNVTLTLTTPIIRQAHDRWGNLLSRTDARGYVTTYSYDHNNKQLTETLPVTDILRENGTSYRASLIHERRYDGLGQLIQETDLVGPYTGVTGNTLLRTRQHVYNQAGELIRDIDALGYSRNYRVDSNGNRVATQDALGTVLVDSYDAMDRQLSHGIIRSGAAVTLLTNQYDQAGRLYAEISGASAVEETLNSVANANWSSTTTGVAGNTRYSLYDERGNIIKTRNESKIEKAIEYDVNNRKVKEIDGLGGILTWAYDTEDFGRLSSRKDLGGRVYSFTYNGFGQLIREGLVTANGSGPDKIYSYYGNGLAQSIVEGTVTRNAAGTVTAEDSRTSSYAYDLSGNRVREVNSGRYLNGTVSQVSSNEVRSKFDEQGRLKELKAPSGNQLVGALGTQYTLVSTARLDSLRYDYDEMGNRRRVYLDTTNQSGSRKIVDDWYKFDLEDRALIVEGYLKNGKVVAGTVQGRSTVSGSPTVSVAAKGYSISYDVLGRRQSSERWQAAIYEEKRDGAKPVDWTYWQVYSGDTYLRSTYVYNDLGQVSTIVGAQVARAGVSDTTMATKSIVGGSYYKKVTYAALGRAYTLFSATYDERGNRARQANYSYSWKGGETSLAGSASSIYNYRGDAQALSELKYSGGVLTQANYFNELGMLDAVGNQRAYRYVAYNANGTINHRGNFSAGQMLFDGYKESQATITRTNGGSPGTTTNTYSARGELQQSVGTGGNVFTRGLATNAEGRLIARRESSGVAQTYLYYQGAALANIGNASAPEVSDTFTPISPDYPGRTPSNYVVNQGDTLESIAQSVWGDSGMWYLIADANGLASSDELTPGDSLKIPNVVSSTHNDATTFKPYDPDDVIGNINPSPKAPPPPKPKKKKSGGLATIVMVVVAVVATVFTAGAATALLGGATLSTAAAAGTAALSAAAAGTAATISLGGAIIGAAVGSAVSQAVGMGMGAVDKFSWGQVAVSGITGGLTYGITSGINTLAQGAQPGSGALTAAARTYPAQGVFNYATSQVANRIAGLDTSFSWRGVAASAAGATVAGYVGGGGQGLLSSGIRGQVSAYASAAIKDKWFGGGRPDYGQVAADAFGNTLGNFFVDQLGQPSEETVRRAVELAGVPPDDEVLVESVRRAVANGATPEQTGIIFNDPELKPQLHHPTKAGENGSYLRYEGDGVWVGIPPVQEPITYSVDNVEGVSYLNGNSTWVDWANNVTPPVHEGLIGIASFAQAHEGATTLISYAAQVVSYSMMGWVAAARVVANEAILGAAKSQVRDYAIEKVGDYYQSKGVLADNADILATGTVFGVETIGGSVMDAVTGAKRYAMQMHGKSIPGKTGTVWDSIQSSGPVHPRSVIPREFELTVESGQKIWVDGNATKHIAEYAAGKAVNFTPEATRLASQVQLESLSSAVNIAVANKITYRQMVKIDGWELVFAPPKTADQLPALYHALYKAK